MQEVISRKLPDSNKQCELACTAAQWQCSHTGTAAIPASGAFTAPGAACIHTYCYCVCGLTVCCSSCSESRAPYSNVAASSASPSLGSPDSYTGHNKQQQHIRQHTCDHTHKKHTQKEHTQKSFVSCNDHSCKPYHALDQQKRLCESQSEASVQPCSSMPAVSTGISCATVLCKEMLT
jgi:hypothetical protein